MSELVSPKRIRQLKRRRTKKGPIVYWMSRDQRMEDNWALLFAADMAREKDVPLCVVFCLVPEYMGATWRQYGFMIKGLQELQGDLEKANIRFCLLTGYPWIVLPEFLHDIKAGALVTDFDPVRIKMDWKRKVVGGVDLPIYEVDAHNVVPCWHVASRKIETFDHFRGLVRPLWDEFLVEFPELGVMKEMTTCTDCVDWDKAVSNLKIDMLVKEVAWIKPGSRAAHEGLIRFCNERLTGFQKDASNPLVEGQSNLSPYLHFGQISGQRVALEVKKFDAPEDSKGVFLDDVLVKKEIADNFCLHNPHYDTFGGFPEWAKRSINEHRSDPREHMYDLDQLENAKTHDPLWNAAHMEMVKRGKMHGSLRPYWALKLLEWSKSPEEAYDRALYLNDKYQLDGRDASGYTGIAMVIGGLYDRPWRSKEVLGKVKQLTYTGQRMRFDVHKYYEMVDKL